MLTDSQSRIRIRLQFWFRNQNQFRSAMYVTNFLKM